MRKEIRAKKSYNHRMFQISGSNNGFGWDHLDFFYPDCGREEYAQAHESTVGDFFDDGSLVPTAVGVLITQKMNTQRGEQAPVALTGQLPLIGVFILA